MQGRLNDTPRGILRLSFGNLLNFASFKIRFVAGLKLFNVVYLDIYKFYRSESPFHQKSKMAWGFRIDSWLHELISKVDKVGIYHFVVDS